MIFEVYNIFTVDADLSRDCVPEIGLLIHAGAVVLPE